MPDHMELVYLNNESAQGTILQNRLSHQGSQNPCFFQKMPENT